MVSNHIHKPLRISAFSREKKNKNAKPKTKIAAFSWQISAVASRVQDKCDRICPLIARGALESFIIVAILSRRDEK